MSRHRTRNPLMFAVKSWRHREKISKDDKSGRIRAVKGSGEAARIRHLMPHEWIQLATFQPIRRLSNGE